jgi:hypothetical protein
MPSIICLSASWKVRHIIGMCFCDKIVLELVDFILVFVSFVFVFINFGFDIKELVSAFASALSSMTLSMH